jgi:ATP-grasp domain, R2K clade family 3
MLYEELTSSRARSNSPADHLPRHFTDVRMAPGCPCIDRRRSGVLVRGGRADQSRLQRWSGEWFVVSARVWWAGVRRAVRAAENAWRSVRGSGTIQPMMLLVPADVLRARRVDHHFAAEADAARAAGMDVALVDHDALSRPGDADDAVRRVPAGDEAAIYRGWMLRSEQYTAFAEALRRRNVTLRTNPEQYRQAHELPSWYPSLAVVTPRSVWTVGDDRAAFDRARGELGPGPAVLRDYTKSMKHYWHEAALIPELDDGDAAWAVATRFRELRGEDMTGGFVLREFERFVSVEVRTWWVDGECRLIGPHPDTTQDMPATEVDLTEVEPLIAGLGLPFVTADVALRADGVWRVIELGDGQVSDRPDTITPDTLIAALRTDVTE